MGVYALTPLAKADIFDIWSHISENSEDAANRVEQAIYDACVFVLGDASSSFLDLETDGKAVLDPKRLEWGWP